MVLGHRVNCKQIVYSSLRHCQAVTFDSDGLPFSKISGLAHKKATFASPTYESFRLKPRLFDKGLIVFALEGENVFAAADGGCYQLDVRPLSTTAAWVA